MSLFTQTVQGYARASDTGGIRVFDPDFRLPPPLTIPQNAPLGILQDPNFNTGAGWSSTGGWYLENGLLKCSNVSGSFFYQPQANYVQQMVVGGRYRLGIYVRELISGGIRVVFNAPDSQDYIFTRAGYLSVVFTALRGDMTLNLQSFSYLGQNLTGSIEWVQITAL